MFGAWSGDDIRHNALVTIKIWQQRGQLVLDLSDPLISNDRKKPTERPALRYGLGEPGHERR